MRFGVTRAVPIKIGSTGSPSTTVILAQDDDLALTAILVGHIVIGTSEGKLPADVWLSLDEVNALFFGQMVQCTPVPTFEAFRVVKNTGTLDDSGFIGPIFFLNPAFFPMSKFVVLPQLGGKFLNPFAYSLLILLFREMSTVGTAARIGTLGVNAFTASTENAVVLGSEPSQIATDQLVVI